MSALKYAHLVGKYIRAERPATKEEQEYYETKFVGGSGKVFTVWDQDWNTVVIMFEYGMGVTIEQGQDWRFYIAEDAELFNQSIEVTWGSGPPHGPQKPAKTRE